jgi:hypothetical protein
LANNGHGDYNQLLKTADMDVLPGKWVHSHEEDTDTEMVFRRATFRFPLSRGRRSFELKTDGSLVEIGIGPTDRPRENRGTWKLEDSEKLIFNFDSQSVPGRAMQIAFVDKDKLILKKK